MTFTPIYTQLFLRESGLVGPVYIDVLSNQVFVLRCVDVYFGGGGFTTQALRVKDLATNATVVYLSYDIANSGARHWEGRQAFVPFPSGNSIEVVADSPMDVSLTGYVLTQPPA